eukprot:6286952-Prymnesium_polylepis.1
MACAGVHCVGGGGRAAKAKVVRELLAKVAHKEDLNSTVPDFGALSDCQTSCTAAEEAPAGPVALFVDDDINEHVAVGELDVENAVLRVLFSRSSS